MGLAYVLPLDDLTVENVFPILTEALLHRESMTKIALAFRQACREENGLDKAAFFEQEYGKQSAVSIT